MNEIIEITAKDNHQFSAYISQPFGKPKAGIVIIQEIFGVNTHIKEVTDLYASKGYLCIAPSLFDRIEKNVKQVADCLLGSLLRIVAKNSVDSLLIMLADDSSISLLCPT